MKERGAKLARTVLAGVLAVGLMPLPAFAAGLQPADADFIIQDEPTAMSSDGQVMAAAYAAANPAPEILGLNNPNQRSTTEAEQTYNFFGDPDINESVDPFLYNTHNNLTPAVTIGGRQGSPMSRLNAYDAENSEAAQNAVWAVLPQIILGTGTDAIPENEHDFYADDARTVETALGLDANSYNPVGVTYNRVNLPAMIQTMYRLAAAANEVTEADPALKTRYEDPMDIAREYERYILGQKGVVKKAIDADPSLEKTIALVQSYDSDAGTYTIITDGVAEGTATTNRYLEAVQGVTKNYYDTVGESGATSVTAAQLKDNVDVIILGGQASTDSGTLGDYLSKDGLLDRTFLCVNWANGSAFGTTVNSVENAQNVGRILPCVYPELLDQSDMVAYYYDVFYHLVDSKIPQIIDERMDGVRNWGKSDSSAYTSWDAADVAGYDYSQVEALLKGGVAYLLSQEGLPEYLTPTSYLAGDKDSPIPLDPMLTKVEVPSAVVGLSYTGEELTGVVEGEGYTVADGTATDAGFYKATATLEEGYAWADGTTGPKTVEWSIARATIPVPVAKTDLVYNGEEQVALESGKGYEVEDGAATDAGEYTAQLSADENHLFANGEDTAEVEWNIARKAVTVIPDSASKVYDEDDPDFTATVTGLLKDDEIDYELDREEGEDAGTYVIQATGDNEQDNYVVSFGSATFTILKATQVITVSDLRLTVGDEEDLDVSLDVGDGELSFATSNENLVSVNDGGTVAARAAGTAVITVTAAETENYNAATATARVAVDALLEIPVPKAVSGLVYNGNSKVGVKAGTGYTIEDNQGTEAGEYTAIATLEHGYAWADGSTDDAEIDWAIAPKSISSVSVSAIAAATYKGSAISPKPVVKDGTVTLKKGVHYDLSYEDNVNAGTATVYVEGVDNYDGEKAVTFTINPKVVTPTVKLSKTSFVYDGKVKTPTLTVKVGSKKIASSGYKVTWPTGRKNVGTYNVKVTLKGNYKGTNSASFEITKAKNVFSVKAAKATQTVKLNKKTTLAASKVFKVTKNTSKGKVTYEKMSGNDKITVQSSGKVIVNKDLKKGSYTVKVKATSAGTKNYKPASKSVSFKVKVK